MARVMSAKVVHASPQHGAVATTLARPPPVATVATSLPSCASPLAVCDKAARLHRRIALAVAPLSRDFQADLSAVLAAVGDDATTLRRVVARVTDGALPMRMEIQDERRLFAQLLELVPLPRTAARIEPFTALAVFAPTTGSINSFNVDALVTAAWHTAADLVVLPEWAGVASALPLSVADVDSYLARLCALTAGSDRLLVPGTVLWTDGTRLFNTAFAFCAGRCVATVHKRGDGGDVDLAHRFGLQFPLVAQQRGRAPFPESGPTLSWRGMRVSLEICRDHGDGRLRADLLHDKRGVVDVQVIVSSGVWVKHPAVGLGGAVVLAQGDDSASSPECCRRDTDRNGTLAPVTTTRVPLGASTWGLHAAFDAWPVADAVRAAVGSR